MEASKETKFGTQVA